MIIKNKTKNETVHSRAIFCNGIASKTVGLMFAKNTGKALIFKFEKEKIISLHMFFVFYPIDVIFLDKIKVVVDMKENFKPFTFYVSKKKAVYAVELPKNTIKKTRTEVGDKIEF